MFQHQLFRIVLGPFKCFGSYSLETFGPIQAFWKSLNKIVGPFKCFGSFSSTKYWAHSYGLSVALKKRVGPIQSYWQ